MGDSKQDKLSVRVDLETVIQLLVLAHPHEIPPPPLDHQSNPTLLCMQQMVGETGMNSLNQILVKYLKTNHVQYATLETIPYLVGISVRTIRRDMTYLHKQMYEK